MIPPRPMGYQPVYLTCHEVAKRHGTSRQQIARMCREGSIFPVLHDGARWLISNTYVIANTVGKHGRPTVDKLPKRPRGRPPGAKNKKPYPKGVKRPRRNHAHA